MKYYSLVVWILVIGSQISVDLSAVSGGVQSLGQDDPEVAEAIRGWERWSEYWTDNRCFEYRLIDKTLKLRPDSPPIEQVGVCSSTSDWFSFSDRVNQSNGTRGVVFANSDYRASIGDAGDGDWLLDDVTPIDFAAPIDRLSSPVHNRNVNNVASILVGLPGIEPGSDVRIEDLFFVTRIAKLGLLPEATPPVRIQLSLVPKSECLDYITHGIRRNISEVQVRLGCTGEYWYPIAILWTIRESPAVQVLVTADELAGDPPFPQRLRRYYGWLNEEDPSDPKNMWTKYRNDNFDRELTLRPKEVSRSWLRSRCYLEAYGISSPFRRPWSRWWIAGGGLVLAVCGYGWYQLLRRGRSR